MNLTKRKRKRGSVERVEGQCSCNAEQGGTLVQGEAIEGRGQTRKRPELFLTLRALSNYWDLENAFLAYTMENNYEGTRADAGSY